jgi:hypothetical protein
MSDTAVRARRGSASQWFAVVLATAGFVLVALALAGLITDDDPPTLPTIELGEMYISGDLAVDVDANVTVFNAGAVPHNLVVESGPKTPDLNSQEAAQLDLVAVPAGSYTVYCAIEGHRAAGMENTLVIGGDGSG